MKQSQPHHWRWRLDEQQRNINRYYRPYELLALKAIVGEKVLNGLKAIKLAGSSSATLAKLARQMEQTCVEAVPVSTTTTHMVQCGPSGSVFVKEYDFFVSQGGLTEAWGKNWKPVSAASIEDARKAGCELFPGARPYDRQCI